MSNVGCLDAMKGLAKAAGVSLLVVIAGALLIMGPLSDGKAGCTFYGDSLAIGASVFVDGQKIGELGPGSPEAFAAKLDRRVRAGDHRVVVVSRSGDSLSTRFRSKAEASAIFSFADSTVHVYQ